MELVNHRQKKKKKKKKNMKRMGQSRNGFINAVTFSLKSSKTSSILDGLLTKWKQATRDVQAKKEGRKEGKKKENKERGNDLKFHKD